LCDWYLFCTRGTASIHTVQVHTVGIMYCTTVVVVDRVYAEYRSYAGCLVLCSFFRVCGVGMLVILFVRVWYWSGVEWIWDGGMFVCVCAGDVCCIE